MQVAARVLLLSTFLLAPTLAHAAIGQASGPWPPPRLPPFLAAARRLQDSLRLSQGFGGGYGAGRSLGGLCDKRDESDSAIARCDDWCKVRDNKH